MLDSLDTFEKINQEYVNTCAFIGDLENQIRNISLQLSDRLDYCQKLNEKATLIKSLQKDESKAAVVEDAPSPDALKAVPDVQ